jgi:hypothetical protein
LDFKTVLNRPIRTLLADPTAFEEGLATGTISIALGPQPDRVRHFIQAGPLFPSQQKLQQQQQQAAPNDSSGGKSEDDGWRGRLAGALIVAQKRFGELVVALERAEKEQQSARGE